jgi:hypothetical protein
VMMFDDTTNVYLGQGAQWLRRPMRLDVTLARVLIGYAFVGSVTESKTYRIYDAILLII